MPRRSPADDGRDTTPATAPTGRNENRVVAAERFLRSLARHGVEYLFSNLGTDHAPLLETASRLRAENDGDVIPEFVVVPHEFPAMSAAHGYAAATGRPQAVLVHVDVGTQNLGAAMHNAHRASVPVYVIAGLAPVTHQGHLGSRDHPVHYAQDVFDQPGIVREYCRWETEYRPPADPDEVVVRGLERATSAEPGPVYLSATREALETPIAPTDDMQESPRAVRATGADADTVSDLAETISAADAPVVVTSDYGRPPADEAVETLVSFAEAAGTGVVEHAPTRLCFPRNHELHVGFDPGRAFEDADLVLLVASDVPWTPADTAPNPEATVVQIDTDPTKPHYPQWSFPVDWTVKSDPVTTLADVTERLDPADRPGGRELWRELSDQLRVERAATVRDDREAGRLTPTTLSDALNDIVDESTVIVEDAVTSRSAILEHLAMTEPGSYFWKGGAGLGWAGGAGVGVKLARPDARVVNLVGDGSYLFAHPTASAWLAAEYDAPTLTVIYNNRGWNAVRSSTVTQHPDGYAADAGVPESRFGIVPDLSTPAASVGAFTRIVEEPTELSDALAAATAAVDDGTPAVLDVRVEP